MKFNLKNRPNFDELKHKIQGVYLKINAWFEHVEKELREEALKITTKYTNILNPTIEIREILGE